MPKLKSSKIEPKTEGVVIDDTPITETPIEEAPVEKAEIDIPESVTADDEIAMEEDITQKAPVKNVRILPNQNHSCSIGGVRYYLQKGVCQNVPLEVKEILNNAGLLSPL